MFARDNTEMEKLALAMLNADRAYNGLNPTHNLYEAVDWERYYRYAEAVASVQEEV